MDRIGGILNLKNDNGLCRSGEGSEILREFQISTSEKKSFKKKLQKKSILNGRKKNFYSSSYDRMSEE
jgi:hypothetical protein